MQSTVVLQSMFCDRLSNSARGTRGEENGKKNAPLVGDGMPRLLTGDEFYNQVSEHRRAAEEESCSQRKEGRAAAMAVWKEAEGSAAEEKRGTSATYKEEVRLWEEERDCAKLEKRRPRWTKPKQGKLESPLPKPTLDDVEEDDECGVNEDEDIDGNDSDGGSLEV
ncbi:hypothetical protein F4604DRAFT_2032175 [Suillus subluteus]|nr:hypothetical protein F4604DRAFT_2032175 [Suillus subluteus]